MINIADLLAVRNLGAAAEQEGTSARAVDAGSDVNGSDETVSQNDRSEPRTRPALAFENGRYYVVDGEK